MVCLPARGLSPSLASRYRSALPQGAALRPVLRPVLQQLCLEAKGGGWAERGAAGKQELRKRRGKGGEELQVM